MHDMAAGRSRLPWSDSVQVTDGTSCGFAPPVRAYGGAGTHPLVPAPAPAIPEAERMKVDQA